MLWWFPLEPLEERYTADWANIYPQIFDSHKIDWKPVVGSPLTDKIEEGEFLDILGRPYFALSQLQNFIKLLKTDKVATTDKLFFADLWHHGIEIIPYINALRGGDLKIYGIFHAGSYDPYDFLHLQNTEWWAQYFERMVCAVTEKIFVGSLWSKQLLVDNGRAPEHRIVITGLPLDCKGITKFKKEPKPNIQDRKFVVFPHRFAPEKGVGYLINVMTEVFDKSENIYLVLTTGREDFKCRSPELMDVFSRFEKAFSERIITYTDLSKEQYYKVLADCHVVFSCALQETFGYGTLEGMLLGCTPVVPSRLSYPYYILNNKFFYNSLQEAVSKILKYCEKPVDVSEYAWRYDCPKVIGRMLKEMELI